MRVDVQHFLHLCVVNGGEVVLEPLDEPFGVVGEFEEEEQLPDDVPLQLVLDQAVEDGHLVLGNSTG